MIGPLFQELINSSVDGILAFDQEYRVTVWNPAMARLFGVSQAKVIGNFAFTVFPFFKETGEDAYYAQALAGKTVVARNRPYVNFQTGQAGFFEGHYSPLMDETGHIVGGMAVIRDITDQKRMLDEMAVLSQVSQAVTSTLDTGAILDMIIAHTTRLLRAAATSVALTDETRGDLYFATAYGENAEFVVGKRLTMGQGIAGWVAQCGQPVLIPDTSRDSRFFKDFDQMGGFTTRSILCVPLQTKGQTVGVIEAMNKESGPFNDQDLRLLALLAAPAATAIEHARLYEQAQREIAERMRMESAEREQRELAEALRDTIAALSSTLNLDKLLERILANVGRVVPHDAATIMLVENDVAQVVGCRGFSRRSQSNVVGMKMPLAQNATLHQMSQTGQPLTIATLNPAEWSTFPQTGAAQSYTGAPIRLKGETVGFINLESATAGFFAPEHGLRLQAFADQASLAIQNARLLAAEREQRQLAEKLREAAAALTSALDLSRVLDNILTQLQQVIPYDSACVFLIEAGTVRAVAGRGFRNLNSVLKIRHPVKDDPLLNEMLKFRQPVYLPDAKADRRFVQWTQAGSTRGWLGVPLIVRDRVIGHLALDSRQPNAYGPVEAGHARAFANQAAIAIENVRLFEETKQRVAELEAIYQVSLSLTSSLDLQAVLEAILKSALKLLGGSHKALIYLYQENRLAFGAALWADGSKEHLTTEPLPTGITYQVALLAKPVVISDIQAQPAYTDDALDAWGGAVAGLPLKIAERVVGVMNLFYPDAHAWSDTELRILRLLADQAALAIENARLFQSERVSRQESEALHRAALALVSTIDLPEVIDRILTELQSVVPYDSASVQFLRDHCTEIIGGRGFADVSAVIGLKFSVTDNTAFPLNYAVITTGQPQIVADVTVTFPEFTVEPHSLAGIRSWLGVPMLVGERVVGMLTLDKRKPDFYTQAHAHLAGAYAAQAAIAIDNARLYQQAQQEIVERKRAEAELQAYREHLEKLVKERTHKLEQAVTEIAEARDRIDAILRSVADGLLVMDLKHQIILANPAAEALLGVKLDDMAGREISSVIKDAGLREAVRETLQSQAAVYEIDVELESLHNGRQRVMRTRTAPVLGGDHGQPVGTVTIIQDITRLREVNRLKSELLTTVAHELRTPLTSILGFSEILLTRNLDQPRRQRYLTMINEQSTQLTTKVNDLLDISRLEGGRPLELKIQQVDMARLFQEVAMPFRETSPAHPIELTGLDALPPLAGDLFRLAQLGRNLLSNAVKYSASGSAIIIAGTVIPGYVQISITDHGIGMTPEQQNYLFEPFYRVDTSNTAVEGAGLGLAISRWIVEQHNGKIWLESQWGRGTTVYFKLPLPPEPASLP